MDGFSPELNYANQRVLGVLEAAGTRGEEALILRPLAVWSRSLNEPQGRWDTWEKELWSVKESTYTNSSMVNATGCLVVPDALNHMTVEGTNPLRRPGSPTGAPSAMPRHPGWPLARCSACGTFGRA